jgi:hypothetical protein
VHSTKQIEFKSRCTLADDTTSIANADSGPKKSAMITGRRPLVTKFSRGTARTTLTAYLEHKHCLQSGCDFDGPSQALLDQHLMRDHFQCAGCKQILPSQNKLNQHSETCKFIMVCPNCHRPCAGQTQLALHLEQCFYCQECDFCTNHEGNYLIVSFILIAL